MLPQLQCSAAAIFQYSELSGMFSSHVKTISSSNFRCNIESNEPRQWAAWESRDLSLLKLWQLVVASSTQRGNSMGHLDHHKNTRRERAHIVFIEDCQKAEEVGFFFFLPCFVFSFRYSGYSGVRGSELAGYEWEVGSQGIREKSLEISWTDMQGNFYSVGKKNSNQPKPKKQRK